MSEPAIGEVSFMEPTLFSIVLFLIIAAISCGVQYFIIKTAVVQGVKDSLWEIEVSMRNAVKNGVIEAMQELEKSKSETENGNG